MHYHHFGVAHMILSALIHAVIYGVIWRIMRHLSLPEDIALAVVVIVAVTALSRISGVFLRRRW